MTDIHFCDDRYTENQGVDSFAFQSDADIDWSNRGADVPSDVGAYRMDIDNVNHWDQGNPHEIYERYIWPQHPK